METNNEILEQAEAIAFWLDPENAEARRQLAERRAELGMWLSIVEARVNAELKKREEQEEVTMKV